MRDEVTETERSEFSERTTKFPRAGLHKPQGRRSLFLHLVPPSAPLSPPNHRRFVGYSLLTHPSFFRSPVRDFLPTHVKMVVALLRRQSLNFFPRVLFFFSSPSFFFLEAFFFLLCRLSPLRSFRCSVNFLKVVYGFNKM